MAPLRADKKPSKPKMVYRDEAENDNEFAPPPASDHEDSYASDDSFQYKPKTARKPKKTSKKLPIFRDDADTSQNPAEQTPRTSHLLRIINSRDINQIKALKGVGAKKADGIVNCLVEMDDAEVLDLESLAMLKGVGGKTVENMRMGLTVAVGYDF
jgi:DNA uptake protein ComE-like DNA-binding protein